MGREESLSSAALSSTWWEQKKKKEMGGKLRYGKNKAAAAFKSLSRAVGRDEGRPASEHH